MISADVDNEVRQAAETMIKSAMGSFGASDVSVRVGRDHDDDPVLYIDVAYEDGGDPIDPKRAMNLQTSLVQRLRELGEDRFPHIRHHFTERQSVVGY
jgi:hypothetical protein